MAQLRYINKTGRTTRMGELVKLDLKTTSKTSFIAAQPGDEGIIGTVAQIMPNGMSCLINPMNTTAWADIQGKPTTFNSTGGSGNSYMPSGW